MQTSYPSAQELGIAGMPGDTRPRDVVSLQSSEAAGVPFGTGVVDKLDGTFEDPDAITKNIRGVLLHSHAYDNTALDPAGVPAKQMGDVMVRGVVVVVPETAVAVGEEAFCRFAGVGTKGAWRNDADSGNAMHVNKARFRSAADAGKPALLELLDGVGEPDIVQISRDVAAITATTTLELGAVPLNRHVKLRNATLSIGAAAQDGTDHYVIQVKSGTTVLASHDTDTAQQGAIVQNTPKSMVLAAGVRGRSLERLTLLFTKNGTATNTTAGAFQAELEVF